jgi:hypothetical protein
LPRRKKSLENPALLLARVLDVSLRRSVARMLGDIDAAGQFEASSGWDVQAQALLRHAHPQLKLKQIRPHTKTEPAKGKIDTNVS